jgi:hypothetical protein
MFNSTDFDWNKLFEPEDKVTSKEIVSKLKEVGDSARKCLTHADFHSYSTKYQDLEDAVIGYMIGKARNFNGDTSKFGAEMLAVIVKVDTLRTLLKSVEADAKKGMTNE